MATQKSKIENQEQENIKSDPEKENMRNEIEQLKQLVQSLLESNKTKVVKEEEKEEYKKNIYSDVEDELDISPTARIRLVSLTVGGLNLRALHHIVNIPEFGNSISVSFEDLRYIVNNHPDLARNGAFIILNEKAVKALYLENDYKKLLGRSDIEQIVNMSTTHLDELLKKVTKVQLQAIVHQFINGIIEGDQKYLDRNKLTILSDHVGADIYQLAMELSK